VNVGISPATNVGAFGRPAQIASEVALAAVLSAFVANGRWRKRARPGLAGVETEQPMVVATEEPLE
jgi:hypothetical protein